LGELTVLFRLLLDHLPFSRNKGETKSGNERDEMVKERRGWEERRDGRRW